MARSVAGLFQDRQAAEQAINDLAAAGFDTAKIGVVLKDKQESRQVAKDHGARSTEGAVAGGIVGGSAGALLAAAGALVIPGIGPFISGGILATSVVGGTAGWLVGGLAGLGIPKEEGQYYEGQVQQGRALVTVDAEGRDAEARSIMLRDGAEDLQDRGFGGGYDTGASGATMAAPRATQRDTTTENELRVPVMEEELVAGKRMEEQGRVHLHKDVIEEQQTISVPLRHEEVHVERVPLSGDSATIDTAHAFVEQTIDVPVMGEEAVVGKRAHQVEEIRLHKDVVTEEERVSETVRKERVVVDEQDERSR